MDGWLERTGQTQFLDEVNGSQAGLMDQPDLNQHREHRRWEKSVSSLQFDSIPRLLRLGRLSRVDFRHRIKSSLGFGT